MRISIALTILITTFLSTLSGLSVAGDTYKAYLKRDLSYFDGEVTLSKGSTYDCQVGESKCCFEMDIGTVCIPLSELSKTPIKKIDISLAQVTVADALDTGKNACQTGKPLPDSSDVYIWSYGFKLKSTEKTDDEVMVEVSHTLKSGNVQLIQPNLTKHWIGKVDQKCHSITFGRKDVQSFLDKYHKVSKILNVESDLNVYMDVKIKLFTSRTKPKYKELTVRFPADNSLNWPDV